MAPGDLSAPSVVSPHVRVQFDANRYPVPPHLVSQPVTIRADGHEVRNLHQGRVVAQHDPLLRQLFERLVRCWLVLCQSAGDAGIERAFSAVRLGLLRGVVVASGARESESDRAATARARRRPRS